MKANATSLPASTSGEIPLVLPSAKPTTPAIPSLLMTGAEVRETLRCGRTKFWQLSSSGAMPKPNRIGLYNRKEIEKWVADGCPDPRAAARARR